VLTPLPSTASGGSDDLCDSSTSFPSTSSSSQSAELTKPIEKMFEDAGLSGILTLRSRKIKDFPAHLCAKYDLSDLISADLSLNRLNELPACMCEIESLETLQLRSNCIQRLPSTIHLLKSLSFLDLSGNHIQSIPPTLFYLRLKVLLLGGNKITTIPREIRQLENCLLELDLSYNSLIELPSDVTLLKSLRVLNLSNNELIDLPQEIGFMHLCALNIEENCLTALPLDFFNLSPYLINLKVNGNPFVSPPVNVILKGREHIFKWLRTQFSIENSQNCGDWNSFNRGTTINATLRRPDKILVQSQLPKSSDPTSTTSLLRKVDRRPRQNR
jgi:Leucine-rich repeat (LRR) protein